MFCRAKEELSLQARKIKRDSEMLQQKECDLQTATEELSIATAENAQKRDQIRGLEAQVCGFKSGYLMVLGNIITGFLKFNPVTRAPGIFSI